MRRHDLPKERDTPRCDTPSKRVPLSVPVTMRRVRYRTSPVHGPKCRWHRTRHGKPSCGDADTVPDSATVQDTRVGERCRLGGRHRRGRTRTARADLARPRRHLGRAGRAGSPDCAPA